MRIPLTVALGALMIAGCGPKALELPTDTVDRAATCGVVAAADARAATDVKEALPFSAQEHILHYPLLVGSMEERFDPEKASRVNTRMSELQENITQGKWQDLKPACTAAFPVAGRTGIEMPADRFDAQLACYALTDFLVNALEGQETEYGNELAPYRALRRKLNLELARGISFRAGSGREGQQRLRYEALAVAANLGAPTAVMRQCVERYG